MALTMLVSTRLPAEVRERLREAGDALRLIDFDASTQPAEAATAEALLTWGATVPEIEAVLARAPRVRWLQSHWAGVDHLLTPAIVASDVVVCNASGAHALPIAEWVLMLIFAFSKRLPRLLELKARRAWVDHPSEEVAGKTVGIVGAGQIGREVARQARAVGLRTLAVRRSARPAEHVEEVFPSERIGELIERSDFVVCTAPLTPETRGLVGRTELARTRPTTYLINVGRGAVVDEAALIEALRTGRLAGAGLDVFETEPLPPDSPLWALDTVVLSPHCCDHTPHTDRRVTDIILDNIRRDLEGQPLRNIVDKRAGY